MQIFSPVQRMTLRIQNYVANHFKFCNNLLYFFLRKFLEAKTTRRILRILIIRIKALEIKSLDHGY